MKNGHKKHVGSTLLPAWVFKDRRKDSRVKFKVELVEPVNLSFATEGKKKPQSQPAILVNISAGGIMLLTFLEPPKVRNLKMVLDLPGIKPFPVEGRITRIVAKGQVYSLGIKFTKISQATKKVLRKLAEDHEEQEAHEAIKRLVSADQKRLVFREVINKPTPKKSKRGRKKRSGSRSRR